MFDIPDQVSSRTLFWLWYERLTLAQKATANYDFQRFVAQVETLAQQQECFLSGLERQLQQVPTVPSCHLRDHSHALRVQSQALRARSQAHIAKSRQLKSESERLLQSIPKLTPLNRASESLEEK